MRWLSHVRIAQKFAILIVGLVLALIAAGFAVAHIAAAALVDTRAHALQSVVETAVGTADALDKQVQAGTLTKEQGLEALRERFHAMTFDKGNGYHNMMETERLRHVQENAKQQAEIDKKGVLNRLADEFESGVRSSLGTLTSAATGMRATSQGMSTTAEETSKQATTVAAAAEQASINVQTVAAATEELSSSVAEIGRQVMHSASIAGQAVEEADRTNATIQGLSSAAQRIGDVIKLISDIASKTNLLALNATIEAARAGDAGRGFAVVASEVKSLASQTGRATGEIAAQIAAIQSATGDAVSAIQRIGGTIGSLNEIATAIASAVEEQGAATQEIARNVQEAAQGTGRVSSTISGINQAAGETGAAANQVLVSAEALGAQGETLRADLDGFLAKIRAA